MGGLQTRGKPCLARSPQPKRVGPPNGTVRSRNHRPTCRGKLLAGILLLGPIGNLSIGPSRGKPQALLVGIRFRGTRHHNSKPGTPTPIGQMRCKQPFRTSQLHPVQDGVMTALAGPRRPPETGPAKAEQHGSALHLLHKVLAGLLISQHGSIPRINKATPVHPAII